MKWSKLLGQRQLLPTFVARMDLVLLAMQQWQIWAIARIEHIELAANLSGKNHQEADSKITVRSKRFNLWEI